MSVEHFIAILCKQDELETARQKQFSLEIHDLLEKVKNIERNVIVKDSYHEKFFDDELTYYLKNGVSKCSTFQLSSRAMWQNSYYLDTPLKKECKELREKIKLAPCSHVYFPMLFDCDACKDLREIRNNFIRCNEHNFHKIEQLLDAQRHIVLFDIDEKREIFNKLEKYAAKVLRELNNHKEITIHVSFETFYGSYVDSQYVHAIFTTTFNMPEETIEHIEFDTPE